MGLPRGLFGAAIVSLIGTAQVPLEAQTNAAAPQFEVASIKPSPPGSRGPTIYNPTLVDRFSHLVTILRRTSVYFQENGLALLA
jgi:hypothetical protein